MKRIYIFILLFMQTLYFNRQPATAQNLVPNPSFEILDSCPDGSSQIDRATGWYPFTSSPDLRHICNWANPCPFSGKGMAGIFCYSEFGYNEIMGIQLKSPLVIGEKYYVSFKARLSPTSDAGINKLGIQFTTKIYCYSLNDSTNLCDSTPIPINNWAHIVTNEIIKDAINWSTIYGSFIADSVYEYIAIGHFYDRATTDTNMVDNGFSILPYYFIDNICVSEDSLACLDITKDIINFTADTGNLVDPNVGNIEIQENRCIDFTMLTNVDYDSISWEFPGAIPAISTDTMPLNICYSSIGTFDVTLIAFSSEYCSDTIKKENYIMVIKDTATFIDDNKRREQNELVIYPNPATEFINIKPLVLKEFRDVFIYDVYGRTVLHIKNPNKNTIEVKSIPSGYYIIEATTDKTSLRKPFLITLKP